MKLTKANEQDKIKALAEMDGWEYDDYRPHHRLFLTSYDAIIPLIQKQNEVIICEITNLLYLALRFKCEDKDSIWFFATPQQLADALLVATGKFEL